MILSIVIPAKNEQGSIPAVLEEVREALKHLPGPSEVLVVNDRSSDDTADEVKQYPFARLINNPYKSGKGAALRAGFEVASGEYIAMMDADYSHRALDLPALFGEARKQRGLVIGSRIYGGSDEYTRMRAFGNVALTWFFGFMHGRYLSDALNGFKVFHGDIFRSYVYTSQGFEIEIELLMNALRLRRPITEYPSHERSRSSGKLKSRIVKHGTLFFMRIIYEKIRQAERRSC